jgi:hypothetical protein
MSAEEIAGLVCATLEEAGITTTLTGGGCVAIWSDGKYVSKDLDFIEEGPVPRGQVKAALEKIGFHEKDRYFIHSKTDLFVEFPSGPLTVGDERVERVTTRDTAAGKLRLLSPTDCVKDRLAAYIHWNDREAFEQALLVSRTQEIDFRDLRQWARKEGAAEKLELFEKDLVSNVST